MAYEMVMPYHLHMPSYFLETFTEYPCLIHMSRNRFFVSLFYNGLIQHINIFPVDKSDVHKS